MFDKTRDMLQATVAKVPTRKGRVTEAGVHGGFTPRGDGRVTMIAASRKPQAASRKPQAASRKPQAASRKPQAASRKPQAASRKPQAVLRPERGREPTRRVTGPFPRASLPA